MRINPAIVFTLILLSLMFGAGVVSASWGYALGRTALVGVRQPDSRPFSDTPVQRGEAHHHNLVILKEDDILNDVKARIEGNLQ
ncbi:MAG: hypothetical protein HC886_02225 [Leptolyngbyaceae cyanobacterium SM1_1_3]|nr:hypothetical protein [Leptolyngbyaceae cyanobacterium SM1_1_3]NJN02790.1 hypothetical protein [Leptolyngbyaceae cyanobacterium RM1_1_2]NJO11202.1 hypothetical protein [Leptolyngbyaceae cyanobacterium SL_1_1]